MTATKILASFVLVVFCHIQGNAGSSCPLQFMKFENSCFSFSDNPVTWGDAQVSCEAAGAKLAQPKTEKINEWLKIELGNRNVSRKVPIKEKVFEWNLCDTTMCSDLGGVAICSCGIVESAWLGGHDMFLEGKWFWTGDESPMSGFSDWSGGQPDNYRGNEDCLEMWSLPGHYEWNDRRCNTLDFFVCEKEAQ